VVNTSRRERGSGEDDQRGDGARRQQNTHPNEHVVHQVGVVALHAANHRPGRTKIDDPGADQTDEGAHGRDEFEDIFDVIEELFDLCFQIHKQKNSLSAALYRTSIYVVHCRKPGSEAAK